jgi:large subunit ribosomal protein L4
LILLPEKNEAYDGLTRAARNLPNTKTLHAGYLNLRDLLVYDRVILPVQALDVIAGYLG